MEISELMVEYLTEAPSISKEIARNILQTAKLSYDEGSLQLLCERLSILWDDYTAIPIEPYKRRWLIKSEKRCFKICVAATELLRLVPGNRSGPFASELSWYGADLLETEAVLRQLKEVAQRAAAEFRLDAARPKGKRSEAAETGLFVRLRELYIELGGPNKIGSKGPLYRFVSACVDVMGIGISVPEPESFRILMMKALGRRRERDAVKITS
jgi:hypothetical protein